MTAGDVHAWYADISLLASAPLKLERVLAWLSPEERDRFDRYRHDADRLMFALGRAMARRLVGRALDMPPAAWHWREGPHGRPEIAAPATALHFNLAHSAGLVCCAIATGREVGIDVEHRSRERTDPAIVARFCAPGEAAAIDVSQPDWHDRFLKYWTLKEAYLKARGLGIAVHLADICFELDGADDAIRITFLRSLEGTDARWAFRLAQPTDRHLVALAAGVSDGRRPAIALEPFPADWLP
jgi:4'-phosphopantetheinyl transferase